MPQEKEYIVVIGGQDHVVLYQGFMKVKARFPAEAVDKAIDNPRYQIPLLVVELGTGKVFKPVEVPARIEYVEVK